MHNAELTVKFKYLFLDKRTGTFVIKAHYSLLIVHCSLSATADKGGLGGQRPPK
jgi:hypothetical protein